MIEKIMWKIFCRIFNNRISDKIDYVLTKNFYPFITNDYEKGYTDCRENIKKDLIKTFNL